MGFLGGLTRAAIPAVTGLMQGQMAGRDRQRQQQMEALQAMLLQERLNEIPLARKDRAEGQARQSLLDTQAENDREFTRKRLLRNDKRVPTQIVDRLGPDGRPRTYQVPEYGGEPMDTGLRPIPEPQGGGGLGSGARLVPDPRTGQMVWVAPGAPGMTVPAGVDTPTPPAVNADITANERSLSKLDEAIRAVQANPDAFGGLAQWALPGAVQGVVDPKGQRYRNPVSDVGSLEIKDRSGATVPKAEMQRLGFIPNDRDPATVIFDKLTRMRNWVKREQAILAEQYPTARGRSGTSKGTMSPAAYEAAKQNGYSDEEIVAEGWVLP